jgi:hypothetical protein
VRINSRKIRKILGRVWSAPKRIFETFCTQEAPRCIDMNATHITIYLLQKINQGLFLYYISCKENKCWKSFKIVRKSFLIILSIHILKLEISGCDTMGQDEEGNLVWCNRQTTDVKAEWLVMKWPRVSFLSRWWVSFLSLLSLVLARYFGKRRENTWN